MIGGNITGTIQVMTTSKNRIGEDIPSWVDSQPLTGYIDLLAGDSLRQYSSKIQESTHLFIGDYVPVTAKPENSRFVVDGDAYEITLIDDPMNLHQHLEIYLKYLGGDASVKE